MTAEEKQIPVVKSAVRTLQILELFDELRTPLNVATVSEALGYPQSSTAALLRSLVTMGYLHFDTRARTFVSTDRVSLLGNWVSPALFENGALPRLLRTVALRTGQMVLLAARNGDFAQYIHVLNAPENVPHHIGLGVKRPLATSGVGQILLSHLRDEEVRRLFHRINAYCQTSEDKIDVSNLLRKLAEIREAGYAFSRNRVLSGFGVIAMSVPNGCANRPLAIGICGECEVLEADEERLTTILDEEMIRHFGVQGPLAVKTATPTSRRDSQLQSASSHAA